MLLKKYKKDILIYLKAYENFHFMCSLENNRRLKTGEFNSKIPILLISEPNQAVI